MTAREALAAWGALQVRLRALGTVVRALEEAGIPSVPVKGALLVHQLYAEPVERPLMDVDLLVRPTDFPRAVRVGRERGYRLLWDSKQLGNVNFVTSGVAVDVASTLGPPGVCAIGVGRVLERARRSIEPLGFAHWQIDWHDHALLVVIDAFKDKLLTKRTVRGDLLRIARSSRFDPATLAERAREGRVETVVALVADWLLSGDESAGWAEVRRRLEARPLRQRYRRAFLRRAMQVPQDRGIGLRLLARVASDAPLLRVAALTLGIVGTAVYSVRHRVLPGRYATMPPPG